MKTLDCRGLECPLPVVKTKEALKEENVVSTIVDNEIAVENLTKFAKVKNYTVNSKKEGKDYIVESSELKSVAAGTGKGNPVTGGGLNYRLLLKKIKEHKPYVHCTLENTVPENAVATREFMERTYASV